ncbi:MAG: hypothetical protein KJT03_12915 [Verrucomicrobiae bacterium]|nr:hypothetical protein [Verrucomicrobiae bacterium]
MNRSFYFSLLLLPTLLGLPHAQSAEEKPAEKLTDTELKFPGIFNSVLPGTEKRSHFKFLLHPHIGDLSKIDYIRNDLGFAYGINNQWEVSAKTRVYFGNGLKDATFGQDLGLADYELGSKYQLGKSILKDWDSAVALNYASPIGHPVSDVTDGLVHREATLSFAKPLEKRPDLRVFWGLTADFISQTGIDARIEDNQLRDSHQRFYGGVIYTRGATTYTLETSYDTTRIWGDTKEDVYGIRPGILFPIPRRFTFNSSGKWLLGLATPVTYGPDGTDVGIQVKMRLDFDFKRLIRGSRYKPEEPEER